jgi:hypothetical protein
MWFSAHCPGRLPVSNNRRFPFTPQEKRMAHHSERFSAFQITRTCRGGGYMYAATEPRHPRANAKGLYALHRVLVENKLGRYLSENEHVHHADGNKDNNSPENLVVVTREEHGRLHAKKADRYVFKCGHCGALGERVSRYARHNLKNSKSGLLFCAQSCAALYWRGRVAK